MEPHITRVRVRYAETDQMGIVHHKNYYVWMEVARVEFCQAHGFRYRDLERDYGVLLAVVESSCRYASSAHFDDDVVIETRISSANPRMVRFSYEMFVEGRPVATGETRHVFLNREMRPTRCPAEYRPLFGLA
ncbi:MAG TPA: thioesterase family protein [Bryobacteraceae bacterium]